MQKDNRGLRGEMMSITIKVVEVIDKLRLNHYFVEKNNRTYFSPIKIRFNTVLIENLIERVINVDGKAYKPNQLERDILKELDF